MKKVIVTGANGFVGSGICGELAERGIEVTAIVRDENSSIEMIKSIDGINIVYLDVSAISRLDEILSDKDYDCMYHLAWTGSAGPLRSDYHVQLLNVEQSCNAVKMAKKLGCKRFVFAASIMEYEVQKALDNSKKVSTNNFYSVAKMTSENMTRILAENMGLEYVGGIISNIYGPGETSPRLVNTTIRKLLNGDHCSFSQGEQLYDFIYIKDASRAFFHLGEDAPAGKSYYIGSAKPRPLKDFLIEIRDIVAPGTPIGLGELSFDGVSLSYNEFDMEMLYRTIGFNVQTEFSDGINKTMKWIKEQR